MYVPSYGSSPTIDPRLRDLPLILRELPLILRDLPLILRELPLILRELPLIPRDLPLIPRDLPLILKDLPLILRDLPLILRDLPLILVSGSFSSSNHHLSHPSVPGTTDSARKVIFNTHTHTFPSPRQDQNTALSWKAYILYVT